MILVNQYGLNFKDDAGATQKIHCPKCHDTRKNKTDKSLSVNLSDRVFKCHHCGWSGRLDGWKVEENYTMPSKTGWSKYGNEAQAWLFSRGFTIDTIAKNKIIEKKVFNPELKKNVIFIGYPYFEPGVKDPVNIKWRSIEDKAFMQEKNAKPTMYNLPFWCDEESVIIVEGENDVLAFNEVGFWNCTTTNGGAINENDKNVDGKLASFHNCFQFIENKKTVYIGTDNDAPGRRLRDELIKRIGAEKCRIINFPEGCKDANETLLKHGKETLIAAVSDSKEIPVSGIFYLSDSMDAMVDNFHSGIRMGDYTYFGDFDNMFRWKKGQINLWIGYMNYGKTSFFMQLAITKSIIDGWKWAIFSPENYPATDFYDDLIEMYVGKNVHDLYHNKMSIGEYLNACDFLNKHFIFIYPEENHTIETLHQKFSFLLGKHGIDGVLIDPYNQVEKLHDSKMMSEEISVFMSTCKRFCVQNDITYNIIVHPKLPTKNADGSIPPADVYDISGGAMWGNKADNIISYHRPNWHKDKTDKSVSIHTQKIKRKRTGGSVGEVFECCFEMSSSRYFIFGYNGQHVYFCRPERKSEIHSDKDIKREFEYSEEAPF